MPFDNRPVELVKWLETQNPNKRYAYTDPGNCLHAQFMRHLGRRYRINLFSWTWLRTEFAVAARSPYTFGAALVRARHAFRRELRRAI